MSEQCWDGSIELIILHPSLERCPVPDQTISSVKQNNGAFNQRLWYVINFLAG